MSERDLRILLEAAAEAAGEWFNKRGCIPPTWFAMDAKGRQHVVPSMFDDKDAAVAMVRALFELVGVKRYVFIDEAWMLDRRKSRSTPGVEAEIEHIHKHGIQDHPERIEIVMFSGEDHEAGQIVAHREIKRPTGKPAYLGPLIWPLEGQRLQSEGRMVGLLPVTGTRQ